MNITKNKKEKKPLTLDDFAELIQKDLAGTKDDIKAIRAEMATKEDLKNELWPIRRDIKTLQGDVRDIRGDVKNITEMMVSKADLTNTIADEFAKSSHGRKIDDLQGRVEVIEDKVGIKPARHRAA
jgi:hypothetical protein